MDKRLQQFISAENISQSQLADSINVAKASISHILSGRNKPGFDFIESMAKNYPNLNLEWLITGKGKMYKGQESVEIPKSSPTIFDDDSLFNSQEDEETENVPKKDDIQEVTKTAQISKILVFYDNGTFKEIV